MTAENYLNKYQNFIFEFDEVLYPEKDYLLQVYYLFAQFIEYAEQKNATEILEFMKASFASEGQEGIFDRTNLQFGIGEKYKMNFDLLLQNVKLPLKLLLFDDMLRFLTLIAKHDKRIYLVATGDPIQALNKIRQTEWSSLKSSLNVYFSAETPDQSISGTVDHIIDVENLTRNDSVFFTQKSSSVKGLNIDIIYLQLEKLFLP